MILVLVFLPIQHSAFSIQHGSTSSGERDHEADGLASLRARQQQPYIQLGARAIERRITMRSKTLLTLRWLAPVLLIIPLVISATALRGVDMTPAVPGPEDRCPVCGMLVEPHEDWLAQLRLEDGSTLFFEGSKDMFRYALAPGQYAKEKRGVAIAGGFVTTWSGGRTVPYESAWFVIGSDVKGPAGEELVAFRNLGDANRFIVKHGGLRVVRGSNVTPEIMARVH